MRSFILRFLGVLLGIYLADFLLSGVSYLHIEVLFVASIILFLFYLILKPLINLLTLPLTVVSLGLSSLLVNAFGFWLLAKVVPGFVVDSFFAGLLGSLIVSACLFVVNIFTKK